MSCTICGSVMDQNTDLVVHQVVSCGECLSEFEVLTITPLALQEIPADEEDWGQ